MIDSRLNQHEQLRLAEQHSQRRRLAGAVGAEEAGDCPCPTAQGRSSTAVSFLYRFMSDSATTTAGMTPP
jgi:hypothetical protein